MANKRQEELQERARQIEYRLKHEVCGPVLQKQLNDQLDILQSMLAKVEFNEFIEGVFD